MEYKPSPKDLSKIKLSKSLEDSIEAIAQNIHEAWALQRQLKGWEYGKDYDETNKKHPCMVEYDKLPESEKDMDRVTVVQTIKMLLLLGYEIEKREKCEIEK